MEHWFTWLDWRTGIWLMILVNQFIGIHVQLYCINIILLLIQNFIVLSIKMQLNELWNWLELKHQSLLNDFVTKSDYLELLLILFPPRLFFNLNFFAYCCRRLHLRNSGTFKLLDDHSVQYMHNFRYRESLDIEINQRWNQR